MLLSCRAACHFIFPCSSVTCTNNFTVFFSAALNFWTRTKTAKKLFLIGRDVILVLLTFSFFFHHIKSMWEVEADKLWGDKSLGTSFWCILKLCWLFIDKYIYPASLAIFFLQLFRLHCKFLPRYHQFFIHVKHYSSVYRCFHYVSSAIEAYFCTFLLFWHKPSSCVTLGEPVKVNAFSGYALVLWGERAVW